MGVNNRNIIESNTSSLAMELQEVVTDHAIAQKNPIIEDGQQEEVCITVGCHHFKAVL